MPLIIIKPYGDSATAKPSQETVMLDLNDISGSGFAIHGGVVVDSSNSKFGGSSAYFDGTGYLSASTDGTAFGVNDFTIECFVNPRERVAPFPTIFNNYSRWGSGAVGLFAGHQSADTTRYQVSLDGIFPALQSISQIVQNQWVHIAVERYNGQISLYINGVMEATRAMNSSLNGSGIAWVGNAGDEPARGYFKGNIDEFRITKGSAVYKGNFTVPTEAFPS